MLIRLLQIGKTDDAYLLEGIQKYGKRIPYYNSFETITLPGFKYSDLNQLEKLKQREAEAILKNIGLNDFTVLLDENGKELTSVEFSYFIDQFNPLGNLSGHSRLNFIIGGAYGFSPLLYEKAQAKISLSRMTFSHQMVRLIFMEQLYRAFTILKKEPYHHI